MALADGYLVDADDLRPWFRGSTEFLPQVLFFQLLDGLPVEAEFLGNILDRRGAAPLADIEGKALGVERVVCEEVELFLLHFPAPPALDAPDLQFQVDMGITAGEVSDPTDLPIIEGPVGRSADATDSFFPCRTRVTTRAWGSPKMPITACFGLKPGKR